MQAGLLLEEAAAAAGKSGHSMETSSVLAPLLSGNLHDTTVTTIPVV